MDRGLHDEVLEEAASLRLQLLECLEQLAARERQLGEVSAACGRYQGRMQVWRPFSAALGCNGMDLLYSAWQLWPQAVCLPPPSPARQRNLVIQATFKV